MSNQKKSSNLYREVNELTPEDTLELALKAKSQDEQDFYNAIGDYLLQKKQRDSIRRNVF